jgi:hypothetical protein
MEIDTAYTGGISFTDRNEEVGKPMDAQQVGAFLMGLDNVEQEENFGYLFFFVGDDHRLGFVTIGHEDNDFDQVSNLNRDGVFRINIGVSRQTYDSLIGDVDPETVDYTVLNVFLPHPHYAKQNFICILNPSGENADITKQLMLEAYSIADARFQRKSKT